MRRHEGKIYINDSDLHRLLVFNDEGKFISKLEKRGQGPQEYYELRDFQVAPNGDIHILSARKIHVYDSSGTHKKDINLKLPNEYHINPVDFAFTKKGYYLFSGSMGIDRYIENQFSIYKIDTTGTFTGHVYFPVLGKMMMNPRFHPLDTPYHYYVTPFERNDTVYSATDKGIYPVYYINYGKRHLPQQLHPTFVNNVDSYPEWEPGGIDYIIKTEKLIESTDFIFFLYRSTKDHWLTFVSKKTGKCFYITALHTNRFFPFIHQQKNNGFIGFQFSHKLIESWRNGSFKNHYGYLSNYNELEKIIAGLDDNDNPVLMKIFLKDF
jgi:hypothetical protein